MDTWVLARQDQQPPGTHVQRVAIFLWHLRRYANLSLTLFDDNLPSHDPVVPFYEALSLFWLVPWKKTGSPVANALFTS